jgi:N-methylhydantoinase A
MRSKLTSLADAVPAEMNEMLDELAGEANAQLAHDGFRADRLRIERALDMRYAGQGYEITLPCPAQPLTAGSVPELRATFDARHKTMFGHMAPQEKVEVVSYRVRGIGLVPQVEMAKFKPAGSSLADARRGARRARFAGAELDCPVYARERLDVGLRVAGPAILEQLDSTTVIGPGQVARVDEWKNLIVTEGG